MVEHVLQLHRVRFLTVSGENHATSRIDRPFVRPGLRLWDLGLGSGTGARREMAQGHWGLGQTDDGSVEGRLVDSV